MLVLKTQKSNIKMGLVLALLGIPLSIFFYLGVSDMLSKITSPIFAQICAFIYSAVIQLILFFPLIRAYNRNRKSHIELEQDNMALIFENNKRITINLNLNSAEILFADRNGKRFGQIKLQDKTQKIFLRRREFNEDDFQRVVSELKKYKRTKIVYRSENGTYHSNKHTGEVDGDKS